jgi:hypothetical protein
MPEIISCPSCQRKLQVPESFAGQKVQCPTCNAQFTAEAPFKAPPPARLPDDEPRRREPDSDDRDRDDRDRDEPRRSRYDDYDDIPRRRDYAPHRGGAVLTLGILGLVLCGVFTAIPAWIMGSKDLTLIREGRMDPAGEGMTRAGYILGIIGTILGILGLIWAAFIFTMIMAEGGRRW